MNIAMLLQVGLPSTRVMAPPATLTIPTSTPLAFLPPLLLTRRRSMAMAMAIAFAKPDKINGFTSYTDPCLDLFFKPVWKGKVITFGDSQYELVLHSIQGDDLKSKAKFMMRTNKDFSVANFPEACDLILEVAVNENLKPEQMVKKVFVFTEFSCRGIDWKPSYEAVRSKFKEQGYGDDAIPKVLIWGLFDLNMPSIVEPHPGLKILSGYSDNLGKVFLDNGGEIGPHQLMEAAIADKEYQALSVVD